MQPRALTTTSAPPFIGREAICREAAAALARGERIVTFSGPGGIGKTRLAREIGEREGVRFPGGTTWVDLASARTLDDFAAELASALELRTPAGATRRLARVAEVLTGRPRMLVVLDDFGALVDQASAALAELARAALSVSFLVTSRERLRLLAETCLPLDALAVPGEDAPPHLARETDAVSMFVAAARAIDPQLALSERDLVDVTRIVRHVEGVPLAIELAAAEAHAVGLSRLAARLADAPPSSQNRREKEAAAVERTLALSWGGLDRTEREALARCALFRGGFTFEAATAVIGGAAGDALAVLQTLHDRSLLRSLPIDELPGERRFHLFESMRLFAKRKLVELGLEQAAARAHASHCLTVCADLARDVDGPDGLVARRRLALEIDNLLDIAERASSEPRESIEAALLLDPILSHPRVPAARLDSMLRAGTAALGDGALAARAWITVGRIAMLEGRFAETGELFVRAREAAKRTSDRDLEALALVYAAGARLMNEEYEEGAAMLADAEAILGERDAPLTRALLLGWRAEGHARREEPRAAAEAYQAALTIFCERGDRSREGMAQGSIALAWLDLGLLERAEQACTAGIDIARAAHSRRDEGFGLSTLGRVLLARGRIDAARASLARALDLHRAIGDRWAVGHHELRLGELELEAGEPSAALLHLARAVELLDAAGDKRYAALAHALSTAAHASADAIDLAEQSAARAGASGDPTSAASRGVHFHLGHLDLARARAAGDPTAAARHLALAKARLDLPPHDSEQARLAARVLRRAIAGAAMETPTDHEHAVAPSVAVDGAWLAPLGESRIELTKRKALQAILAALVRARRERPGEAISATALFAAGWPDERDATKESRVFVAVTRLRKLGLGAHLLSRDDGFLLDTSVVLV